MEIPGIDISLDEEALILYSKEPLTILSSAVVGGGLARARFIVNRHVKKGYDCSDPATDMRAFVRRKGITDDFVGLMTAVFMQNTRFYNARVEDVVVGLAITAGYSNRIAAGLTPPVVLRPGTINIILLIDAHLSAAAMVNAVITATEAKTAILQDWQLLTSDGHVATGTSTDAVVVACTGRGPKLPYAGPVTPVGATIARLVRMGLAESRP